MMFIHDSVLASEFLLVSKLNFRFGDWISIRNMNRGNIKHYNISRYQWYNSFLLPSDFVATNVIFQWTHTCMLKNCHCSSTYATMFNEAIVVPNYFDLLQTISFNSSYAFILMCTLKKWPFIFHSSSWLHSELIWSSWKIFRWHSVYGCYGVVALGGFLPECSPTSLLHLLLNLSLLLQTARMEK